MNSTAFSKRQKHWQELIRQHEHSGQTQSEFCKSRGIGLSTFRKWSAVIKGPSSQKNFARVDVRPEGAEPLRLVFRSGATLHFSQTPDPAFLAEVLRLVA